MSSESKNLEAISQAIDTHNRNCPFPAVAVAMNPFEVERLGWDEIRGLPLVRDLRHATTGDRHEALVAEWDGGAGLDTASMNAVAEAVTTSRIALAGIRTATGKLSRER